MPLTDMSQFLAQRVGFRLAFLGSAPEAVLFRWVLSGGAKTSQAIDLDLKIEKAGFQGGLGRLSFGHFSVRHRKTPVMLCGQGDTSEPRRLKVYSSALLIPAHIDESSVTETMPRRAARR